MFQVQEATTKTQIPKPLQGIRILDMTRLAPGPYASMLLADLGAEVLAIGGGRSGLPVPALSRGKDFVAIDLKTDDGQTALRHLVTNADVIMEGFRPGVAERLGAGYEDLRAVNPNIIYCSLTGYGQDGPLSQRAGHDINYLAMSGALGTFGPAGAPPIPPLNLVADFGGGGLFAAVGILSALHSRSQTGEGSYIDVAMIDGVMSLMGMNFVDWGSPTLPKRGEGVLSGTLPFYRCYKCSDGRFVAVGALERAFFANLWTTLDLGDIPDHLDENTWPLIEERLTEAFASRTRKACEELFAEVDACVSPVLEPHELKDHPHISSRDPLFNLDSPPLAPKIAPHGQRNPTNTEPANLETLMRYGLPATLADSIVANTKHTPVTGLSWPPL
ncbi:CaiB/BaiF CoA-transferase family protein [Arthrobacter rhombi]|uniref:CaiB/BaiF CoA transferase family protein n=1 Tax=Arthrobacter rhombi TaxID=71253 RepID=UPI0031D08CE4